jgi:hypothetical protein
MGYLRKFSYLFLLLFSLMLLYFKYSNQADKIIPSSHIEEGDAVSNLGLSSSQRKVKAAEKFKFIEKHKHICDNSFSLKLLDLLNDAYPDFRVFTELVEEYFLSNARNMTADDVLNIIDLIDSIDMEWILSDSILQSLVTSVSEHCIMDERVIKKITSKFDSETTKTCIANGVFSNGNIREGYNLEEYANFSLRVSRSYGIVCTVEYATLRFVTAKGEGYLSGADFANSFEKLLVNHDISQFETFIVELDDQKFSSLVANKFINLQTIDYFSKIRKSWIDSIKLRSGQ